jgi:two-component system, cell cycle response regulator DivK
MALVTSNPSVPAETTGTQRTRAMAKSRILIAEDHPDSREALRELLEAFGFEVLEAMNGEDAVRAALEERPRLILMDVMMPEKDGFQAIREIRQIPELARTPIIAVTAMDGARELALTAGANDYVRKPVDIRRLIGMVNGWLSREDH